MRQTLTPADHVSLAHETLGPGPWPVTELMALGWTRRRIEYAVDHGWLARVRRGLVAPWQEGPSGGPADVVRWRAALAAGGERAALSHWTAARVHDQWVPYGCDPAITMITVPGVPDRQANGVRVRGTRLRANLVEVVDGLAVTSVARTAVDLARGRRLPDALVCLDGGARALAFRHGLSQDDLRDPGKRDDVMPLIRETLWDAYESLRAVSGTVVIRDALGLVSLASESPLESRSRGHMLLAHLPRAVVGMRVRGASGRWYFADFGWPEHGVLGEADGFSKYGLTPEEVAEKLREERRRQRDLEDAGWRFVRWDSSEMPKPALARIAATLADAAHGPMRRIPAA